MVSARKCAMPALNSRHIIALVAAVFIIFVWIFNTQLIPSNVVDKVKTHVPAAPWTWKGSHESEENHVSEPSKPTETADKHDSETQPSGAGGQTISSSFNSTVYPLYYSVDEDRAAEIKNMTQHKPPGMRKVVGLLFYGRRATVSILDCYLRRNLVKNGGILDSVVIAVRTKKPEDLALLDEMVAREPAYERWVVDTKKGYGAAYDKVEDDVMYIKMDDDIIFIEDGVIASLVHTRAEHPEYYGISANVVNQPMISWMHWNLGAIRPYLPETKNPYPHPLPTADNYEPIDWRASSLPSWDGGSKSAQTDQDWAEWENEDGARHRWLPVRGHETHILEKTPIEKTQYDPFGIGWKNWRVGAQQHYSMLENLEKNELWRYRYRIWDYQFNRVGIQFYAVMGRDLNLAKPIAGDDEQHLSVTTPKKLGRHSISDGSGVVVHYSFSTQYKDMRKTDILERYRSFAKENICHEPMLWSSTNDD